MFGINGHKRTAPATADVPIIGQPFEVQGCQVTVLLVCKCDPQRPRALLITNTGAMQCKGCGKAYTVHGLSIGGGKPPQFNIGVIVPERAADQKERSDV